MQYRVCLVFVCVGSDPEGFFERLLSYPLCRHTRNPRERRSGREPAVIRCLECGLTIIDGLEWTCGSNLATRQPLSCVSSPAAWSHTDVALLYVYMCIRICPITQQTINQGVHKQHLIVFFYAPPVVLLQPENGIRVEKFSVEEGSDSHADTVLPDLAPFLRALATQARLCTTRWSIAEIVTYGRSLRDNRRVFVRYGIRHRRFPCDR